MTESQSVAESGDGTGLLVLGVDTCGPMGSVALARVEGQKARILGQKELAGRSYSETLVTAVSDLLVEHGIRLADLDAIVVVQGPGSFTGIRVGLSAVKGLAEPGQIPVVSVSRLAVLAAKAGAESAALDAHRNEVFLLIAATDGNSRELLAGAEEISQVSKSEPGAPSRVAVCDDSAAEIVDAALSKTEIVRVEAPTAADAIGFCVPVILAGEFADLALLDGHYLRRSDAEILGDKAKPESEKASEVRVRRMGPGDIDAVMEIAAKTHHAPGWVRAAYRTAIAPLDQRRVALVAEREGSALAGFVVAAVLPGGEAELESIVTAAPDQRRGVARELFATLKHELRRQGVREVMLEVREGNHPAQGFYRFLGFREEARRPRYYSDPVEDAVLMRLKIG
jgi:tRNA threonylcarbamoyladenosine biosynthesis protein TsaB